MAEMIQKVHNEWTKLYKQRKVETTYQHKCRKKFLAKSKGAFWAAKPNCESMLNDRDKAFLNTMKMPERPVGIGKF